MMGIRKLQAQCLAVCCAIQLVALDVLAGPGVSHTYICHCIMICTTFEVRRRPSRRARLELVESMLRCTDVTPLGHLLLTAKCDIDLGFIVDGSSSITKSKFIGQVGIATACDFCFDGLTGSQFPIYFYSKSPAPARARSPSR